MKANQKVKIKNKMANTGRRQQNQKGKNGGTKKIRNHDLKNKNVTKEKEKGETKDTQQQT